MEWTRETSAWECIIRLKDDTLLQDLKFFASGAGEEFGVSKPKGVFDPASELRSIIERALLIELYAEQFGGRLP